MAIEYTATTAPDGRWHFVADASTGDVLIVESLELFASITGKVTGTSPRQRGHGVQPCATDGLPLRRGHRAAAATHSPAWTGHTRWTRFFRTVNVPLRCVGCTFL